MGVELVDDPLGNDGLAKPIALSPAIAFERCTKRHVEPDRHARHALFSRQIHCIVAIASQRVGRVEDDGPIGLEMSAGALFNFREDNVAIEWIASIGAKIVAHLIRSNYDRTNSIGICVCPMAFAGTG